MVTPFRVLQVRILCALSHGRITFTIFGPFFYVENNLVQKSTVDDTVDYIIHNDSKLLALKSEILREIFTLLFVPGGGGCKKEE